MISEIILIATFLNSIIGFPNPDFTESRYVRQSYEQGAVPYAAQIPETHGEYGGNPSYDFKYGVHDYNGNKFGHQETKDGYNTKGSYHVDLPDGRRQTVTYYVDKDSGYVANVHYEGEAKYPDTPNLPYQNNLIQLRVNEPSQQSYV